MEDQIQAAKLTRSKSGVLCLISSGITAFFFSIVIASSLGSGSGKRENNLVIGFCGLGLSSALAALSSISNNQKKIAAFTALLVAAQNSASALPSPTIPEYSDLLEDSDNK